MTNSGQYITIVIVMDAYTTITPRFQVHIPVSIRRKVGLTGHGRARVGVWKSKIVIEPIKSKFMGLSGKYKIAKPIRAENIRDFIDYSEGK